MKKVASFLLIIATLTTILTINTLAVTNEPVAPGENIVVPLGALEEIIEDKIVYSNFVDAEGNYYDYYCPDDGSYFRWKAPNDSEEVSTTAATYTEIRNFEFKFAADGLNGKTNKNTFKIAYDAGKYSVYSYLYDHYQGKEVDTKEKYAFTVELKQDKALLDKSISTLNAKTGSTYSTTFSCTKDKTYYFVLKPVDDLPDNTANHMYYFKGSGSIYGKTDA